MVEIFRNVQNRQQSSCQILRMITIEINSIHGAQHFAYACHTLYILPASIVQLLVLYQSPRDMHTVRVLSLQQKQNVQNFSAWTRPMTEGSKIEAWGSRGGSWGGAASPLPTSRESGERCELPHWSRGGTPTVQRFPLFSALRMASLVLTP